MFWSFGPGWGERKRSQLGRIFCLMNFQDVTPLLWTAAQEFAFVFTALKIKTHGGFTNARIVDKQTLQDDNSFMGPSPSLLPNVFSAGRRSPCETVRCSVSKRPFGASRVTLMAGAEPLLRTERVPRHPLLLGWKRPSIGGNHDDGCSLDHFGIYIGLWDSDVHMSNSVYLTILLKHVGFYIHLRVASHWKIHLFRF